MPWSGYNPFMSRHRSQVREVINRNTVVSLALEQGFNAYLPVFDGGVDFILHREARENEPGGKAETRKIQLKGRWTIGKKYIGRDIWIAFPVGTDWYLMPHDEMLEFARSYTKALEAVSWTEGGVYSWPKPSKAMMAHCKQYRFASIAKVAAEAAEEAA